MKFSFKLANISRSYDNCSRGSTFYRDSVYRLHQEKTIPLMFDNNFGKRGQFSKFFHQLIHKKILYVHCMYDKDFHLTCYVLLTCYTGCQLIVSNSKLPQWPIKEYIPVTAHIWLIWSIVTLHAEPYGWSASANLLSVTRCNISFGARGFRSAAPAIWISLPSNVRSYETLKTFHQDLESHLFHSASATA